MTLFVLQCGVKSFPVPTLHREEMYTKTLTSSTLSEQVACDKR